MFYFDRIPTVCLVLQRTLFLMSDKLEDECVTVSRDDCKGDLYLENAVGFLSILSSFPNSLRIFCFLILCSSLLLARSVYFMNVRDIAEPLGVSDREEV